LQEFPWEEGSSNLLSDTTSFSTLHISVTEFIEDLSLSSIDVTHDTDDRTTKLSVLVCFSLGRNLIFTGLQTLSTIFFVGHFSTEQICGSFFLLFSFLHCL
jgi:Na+/pantothenate symporter